MDNTFGINIIPHDEVKRVEALKRYKILDTPPEGAFDNVARLATQIFGVPISLISLVDSDQVYFKSNIGMGAVKTTSRGVSLCSLSVLDENVTVFENAPEEPCLFSNPNVAGSFGLKFYAGAPITTPDGFRIGTLCIIDKSPRQFDGKSRMILQSLAKIVMDEIELRLSSIHEIDKHFTVAQAAAAMNEELMAANEELLRNQTYISELNGQLATTNQEIIETISELTTANQSLTAAQKKLLVANAKLAESEELKKLAIEQAGLGTWYISASTRQFMPSARLKEFFGFSPDESMSYDAALNQIQQDFKATFAAKVDDAIALNEPFFFEFPVVGDRNNTLRWLRAIGKINPADHGRKSYFSGIMMDITEQKENDERKNAFVSMVSHELKTPLTSMGGYVQVLQLRANKTGDATSHGILERALIQVRKMTALIEGFLNMTRSDTGAMPLTISVFDLAELVNEAEVEAQATISTHKVVFAPVEKTIIKGDRDKLSQVITNLINNAVKYSPRHTVVNVACVTIDHWAHLSVKDVGMGISLNDQKRLFERFYRVENEDTARISGFGIGLYLCEQIVKAHNGEIRVESELGKGSVFKCQLPVYLDADGDKS